MSERQPMFHLPAAVTGFAGLLIAIHLGRSMLSAHADAVFLLTMSFIPARFGSDIVGIPGGDIAALTSWVSYTFLHGDFTHLLINLMWMMAFGSAVAKRIGSVRFVVFSLLCSIAGAAVHLASNYGSIIPVVGASAAISGQMAAAIRFVFGAGERGLAAMMHGDAAKAPLSSIAQTLTNPGVLIMIGVWLGLNLLFGLGIISMGQGDNPIAWEAHMGGFVAGLFSFGLFDRQNGISQNNGSS